MNACSLWDKNYAIKGMALYNSLMRHSPDSLLYILAMDNWTFEKFRWLKNTLVWNLESIEREIPKLAIAKSNRTWAELCWTCGSVWLWKCLQTMNRMVYLDADSFILSNPDPIYEKYSEYRVALVPHRFAKEDEARLLPNGFYNVNWVQAKSRPEFVEEWKELCLDWCYNRIENGKFGDQKYLECLSLKYHAKDIEEPTVGLGPWGINNYQYEIRDGKICIGTMPVVAFHCHESVVDSSGNLVRKTNWKIPPMVDQYIYEPYQQELLNAAKQLAQ